MMNLKELQQRNAIMQQLLARQGLDGALFVLPIDIYYFTGTRQNGVLWIPVSGEQILMVRKSLERARRESPLPDIRPFPPSKQFAAVLQNEGGRLGMTFDAVPVQQLNFYRKLLPETEFVDLSVPYRQIRALKSAYEIQQLKHSGEKLSSVFTLVPEFLCVGMSELDLAAEFEYRLRKKGGEGYVRMRAFNQELALGLAVSNGAASYGFFDGAVTGAGLSGASPQGASLQEINKNRPVLLDYTGVFNGYITDMTRMFVIGDLDAELKRAFEVALEIQRYLQQDLKPGVICEELFFKAEKIAKDARLSEFFMGMPGEQTRFVGHGVGLELDEFPVLAQGFRMPLQEGHSIAIEPKFVFPGKGVIGIENTFIATASGGLKVTKIPDDVIYL
jgi:Xaa-Pro aminopeptidase